MTTFDEPVERGRLVERHRSPRRRLVRDLAAGQRRVGDFQRIGYRCIDRHPFVDNGSITWDLQIPGKSARAVRSGSGDG